MDKQLLHRNAIVCGSTQGIGKAIAMELAALGANITLIARNENALKDVLQELPNNDQQHDHYVADFTNIEELRKTANEIAGKKPIHILINNTGGPPAGNILDAGDDEFIQAFSNHLICNHILVKAFVDGMKSEKYGRIINVISTSVYRPIKGLGVSNTIRAAVANWARTLAMELGPFGITVNNILPGTTNTVRLENLIETWAKQESSTVEKVKERMTGEIPMQRFADASEIANVAAFLATPKASYVSGTSIPVDGGRTL